MKSDEQGNSQQKNQEWNGEMRIREDSVSGSTKAHFLLVGL